jgi:V8-like Glu-specific endopeptidase
MLTKSPNTLCVLLLLGLSACGTPEVDSSDVLNEKSNPPTSSLESNVIVGSLDWVSVTSLPTDSPERARSKAVGYLQYNIRYNGNVMTYSRCTAWLASKDVVITNSHCINTNAEAVGARVAFNYENGAGSRIWYDCSTLIRSWGNGDDDDMAALRCQPRNGVYPGETYGYLKVSNTDVTQKTPIYVIHQNCNYEADDDCSATKKYSPGKVLNTRATNYWMSHDADTLKGSSGGPMLSQSSHEVVGLNRGNNGSVNMAVRGSIVRARLAELGL